MQEFCSVCLDSTEDNTDKEGDAVNYMFNQFIDEKDCYYDYCALEIIQSDIVLYNATSSLQVFRTIDIEVLSNEEM